jgi:hypothetical protein
MKRVAAMLLVASSVILIGTAFSAPQNQSDGCPCEMPNPDHLVPVSFDSDLQYKALLIEKLYVSQAEYGRAVIIPSAGSEGETCVAVYSSGTENGEPKAHVVYTRANRNIWYLQSESNPKRTSNPVVKVKQTDAAVSESTALAISRAWKQMLCRTRPAIRSGSERAILDATTVQFSLVNRDGEALYGQLPQPPTEGTTALYKLTELLIAYCDSDASKRPDLAKKIEDDANTLVAKLQAKRSGP